MNHNKSDSDPLQHDSVREHKHPLWEKILDLAATLIRFFVHPAQAIAPIFIGVVLSILVLGGTTSENRIISFIVTNQTQIWIYLLLWLFIAVILSNNDKTVSALKERILEQNDFAKSTAGLLANKYGEIACFSRNLLWDEALHEFVHANFEIDSCQLFTYTFSRINDQVRISVHYVTGYANEGVESNAMLQSYFEFPYAIYEQFSTIIQLWKSLQTVESPADLAISDRLFTDIVALTTLIKNQLKTIDDLKGISSIHCIQYRLLLMLIALLKHYSYVRELKVAGIPSTNAVLSCDLLTFTGQVLSSDVSTQNVKKVQQIEECLERQKRTGILGCILLQDTFGFLNGSTTGKNGRVYIGFPLNMFDKDMIVMLSMPSATFDGESSKYHIIERVKEDFIERVSSKK